VYTIPRAGRPLGIVAVVLTLGLLGCNLELQSPFVPVVTNDVDNFDFQVVATGASRTVRYTWTTTATAANVSLQSSLTAGTAHVTITDADATQVFDHALDGSGPTVTTSATAGDWLIIMTLSNVTGTIHFSLSKP
jgi:hypothetical protein